MPPVKTDHHREAHPTLRKMTNSYRQAHLAPLMKTTCRRQIPLAQPVSASNHRPLAQRSEGVDIASAKQILLPIPLQRNARKSSTM